MRRVAPAATEASAVALPCAVSMPGSALSQTGDEVNLLVQVVERGGDVWDAMGRNWDLCTLGDGENGIGAGYSALQRLVVVHVGL